MKNFAFFFIDRPRFATVIALIITFVGAISYFTLPVSQFPEVAPPTVVVRTAYPGATPEVLANTVAASIEQEVNGVEGMLYMNSQSTADGAYQLTVTFELGTNLDDAQVLVQNRVAIAEARLPETVRRIGVTVQKSSPDLLMVVQMFSPDDTFDMLYVSNYALLQVRERLRRLEGIGDVRLFGGREYSMRVWLNPERLAFYQLTPEDVVGSLRQQNLQVAAGVIGQQPVDNNAPFQLNVSTLGRLSEIDEFEKVIVKRGDDGSRVTLQDVARIELGALDYNVNAYLNETRTLAMPIFQRPGSNALDTSQAVRDAMEELATEFPEGLEYAIVYDPTQFIDQSIDAVVQTLIEAVLLVTLVMIVFLQSWRAAIIPVLAIPVALVGTFAAMSALGYSLNNLTLFGLVLAIGIVVDDAIVVVENISRNLSDGLSPKEATQAAMAEVSGALVATTLVLLAVFIPTGFIEGITGQFYRQFAITLSVSTVISTLVSLTLSPALGVLLLRKKGTATDFLSKAIRFLFGWFFKGFNWVFDKVTALYGAIVARVLRLAIVMLLLYAGLNYLAYRGFQKVPGGFIPQQDQGYLIVAAQLPTGTGLHATNEVLRNMIAKIRAVEGVSDVVSFAGFNGATFSNATNAIVLFPVLEDFESRLEKGLNAEALIGKLRAATADVEAFSLVLPPPTVRGLGNGGGFKLEVQDRVGLGPQALEGATWALAGAASQDPAIAQAFTPFTSASPQLFADIDREKALALGVPLANVFGTLETYLGSSFVNELNLYGRTFRVTAQADNDFRDQADDIGRLKTRNSTGGMVPLSSLLSLEQKTGPDRVVRHNLFPAADLLGVAAPGVSTGEALAKMEVLAAETLPPGIGYEWIDLAYQEKNASGDPTVIFGLAILFVFLLLAAQYESWALPLAVVLTVPLCLAGAIWGVSFRDMDNNILTQIGLVVLVALASKNAILIVEFAKQLEDESKDRFAAALEGAKLRLRPITMTAFAFILGVLPLVFATGPGAEMRQALGTVVFAGMIAVTFFGIFFAPLFYVLVRRGAAKNKETAT